MNAHIITKIPKRNEPGLTIRLDRKVRHKLKKVANEERRSLAAVVEIAVIKFLEERSA